MSATVGMLLKAIENANEKVGTIISGLLGLGWTVMTYFVVPVLVIEKVGPFQAIQQSMAILHEPGARRSLAMLAFPFSCSCWPCRPFWKFELASHCCAARSRRSAVSLIVLAVLGFLLVSTISSALNGIFLTVLYQYAANGQVPTGFDRECIAGHSGRRNNPGPESNGQRSDQNRRSGAGADSAPVMSYFEPGAGAVFSFASPAAFPGVAKRTITSCPPATADSPRPPRTPAASSAGSAPARLAGAVGAGKRNCPQPGRCASPCRCVVPCDCGFSSAVKLPSQTVSRAAGWSHSPAPA